MAEPSTEIPKETPQEAPKEIPQATPEAGVWKHPEITDLRSPCPVLNALANHGYLPRDGRNVTREDFRWCLDEIIGLAPDIAPALYLPTFLYHEDDLPAGSEHAPIKDHAEKKPILHGMFALASAENQSDLGVRDRGQVNAKGEPVINLDQLKRHGAIEHDISLTRRDVNQGDNLTCQPDLLEKLLASSKDGKVFTATDLAHFRNERYRQQMTDNPKCQFGFKEKFLAWGEVAMILLIFGGPIKDGYDKIPYEYLKALFAEERLPINEGWKKRLVPVGFAEITANSIYVQTNAAWDH